METLYREPLLSQITPFLCFSAADMTFTVFCIVMFFGFGFVFGFFFLLSGMFHQKTAVKYFSHMKSMKNIHWLRASLNCGIYQTGIVCYFTVLCCLSSCP